mmetsp:Transcript_96174/g.267202  ORF Transcript_96174/g.267202 Transcript_96174/m.267202 type:complete len:253 (-) Transcript_96174:1831-2589(-)
MNGCKGCGTIDGLLDLFRRCVMLGQPGLQCHTLHPWTGLHLAQLWHQELAHAEHQQCLWKAPSRTPSTAAKVPGRGEGQECLAGLAPPRHIQPGRGRDPRSAPGAGGVEALEVIDGPADVGPRGRGALHGIEELHGDGQGLRSPGRAPDREALPWALAGAPAHAGRVGLPRLSGLEDIGKAGPEGAVEGGVRRLRGFQEKPLGLLHAAPAKRALNLWIQQSHFGALDAGRGASNGDAEVICGCFCHADCGRT